MIGTGRRHGGLAAALSAALLVWVLAIGGLLRPLENAVSDLRARWLEREVASQIVIVAIDSPSLSAFGHRVMPRRQHARLLEELSHASPRSVYLEVDLSEASPSAEDDALLEATLARRRNFPVILPIFVRPAADSETAPEAVAPLPRFARSVDLVAVQTAPRGGAPTREWRDLWSVDGERTVSVIDPHRQLRDGQPVLIDFSIAPSSFVRVSYLDVLEGRVPREVFADRRVFVGPTTPGHPGTQSVPVFGQMPGTEVQAIAAETVNAGILRPAGSWITFGLLMATALLAWLLFSSNWRRNLLVLALLYASIAAVSVDVWLQQRLLIATARPCWWSPCCSSSVSVRWFETRPGVRWPGARHAPPRRAAQERGAVLHRQHRVHRRERHRQDGEPGGGAPVRLRRLRSAGSSPSRDSSRCWRAKARARVSPRCTATIRECDARTLGGEVFPVEIS